MASKAGAITEIILDSEVKKFNEFLVGLEKGVILFDKFNQSLNKSGGALGKQSDIANYDAQVKETERLKKSLADLTAKQQLQNSETAKAIEAKKEEIKRTKELSSAYDNLKRDWENAKKTYKDMAAQIGTTSRELEKQGKIVTDLDQRIKKIDFAVGEFGKNVGNYPKFLQPAIGSWLALTGAMTAMVAAGAGVISFLKESVTKAAAAELANSRLLLAVGGNRKEFEKFKEMQSTLSEGTLFSKAEIREATNFSVAMGKNAEQTERMIKTAMGLAAVTGKDLNSSMLALAGTYEGTLGKMARYDGKLKELTKEQLANGAAVDILYDKFGKFATSGMETAAGAVDRYEKAWGKLKATIGAAILSMLGFKAIEDNTAMGKMKKQENEDIAAFTGMDASARKKYVQDWEKQAAVYFQKWEDAKKNQDEKNRQHYSIQYADTKQFIDKLKALNFEKEKKDENAAIIAGANAWDEYVRSMQAAQQVMEEMAKGTFVGPSAKDRANAAGNISTLTPKGTPVSVDTGYKLPEKLGGVVNSDDQSLEMKKWNARLQIASEFTAKLTALGNTYYQNELNNIDAEIEATKSAKEKELEAAGGNKRKEKEINDRYAKVEKEQAKERKKMLHDQAVYAKAAAAIQTIINTAVAATAQMSIVGAGPAMAAIVIALGAIELATVLAQQVPSYEKGRKGGKAEIARVSERGQEGLVTRQGNVYALPASESLAYLPEGSSVIPHEEWKQALLNSTIPNYYQTTTSGAMGYPVVNVERNPVNLSVNFDGNAMLTISKENVLYEQWLNRHVRFNG